MEPARWPSGHRRRRRSCQRRALLVRRRALVPRPARLAGRTGVAASVLLAADRDDAGGRLGLSLLVWPLALATYPSLDGGTRSTSSRSVSSGAADVVDRVAGAGDGP